MILVCGATCTERPEKATGEILGHTAMKVGPCLLPPDHGDLHDPAPIFLGHLDGQRWQPPVVRCVCPSCGKIDDRTPSSWSFHGHLTLRARFGCAPLRDWAEDGCHRLFDLVIELPPSHRTADPAPAAPTQHPELDPPQVEVMGEDLAHLINPHGALLAALNYEQLLVLQERVEDAVATMALLPSTTPSTVKRPRKERRDGKSH